MTRLRRQVVPIVATACGVLAACSLIVPLDEQQCGAAADCAARGPAFAGAACVNHLCVAPSSTLDASADAGDASPTTTDPWGCLDRPPEVTDPSTQVAITLKVFDALQPITTAGPQGGDDFTVLTYTPASGITAQGCDLLDPKCANAATPANVTDDAGQATFTVPGSFNGFFKFTAADYLPSVLYIGQLLPDASTFAPPVAILGTNETSLLATALGVTMHTGPDAGVGHAFFQVYDCFDRHAEGVAFTLAIDAGPETVQWYYNQIPSPTAKATDYIGAGGVVNVPIGALTTTATLVDSHRTIGVVNTFISPGTTVFSWFRVRTH